jgi:hypothetical protein
MATGCATFPYLYVIPAVAVAAGVLGVLLFLKCKELARIKRSHVVELERQ